MKVLGAGVSEETYRTVNERAEEEGESVSSWLRSAIERKLGRESANGDREDNE